MLATLLVNEPADLANPPAGKVTLRGAVLEANALPGSDTIFLPPGTFSLFQAGEEVLSREAETGDLDILDSLTVFGAGAGATVVDGAEV
ncbi:MAG: hypothetical protein WD278_03145, partial [Pirellulales bacterium]